jgi:hypothetical protein
MKKLFLIAVLFLSSCVVSSTQSFNITDFYGKKSIKPQKDIFSKLTKSGLKHTYFLNDRNLKTSYNQTIFKNPKTPFEFADFQTVEQVFGKPDFTTNENPYIVSRYDGMFCSLFVFSMNKSFSNEVIYAHSQNKTVRKISLENCAHDIINYKNQLPYND